MVTPTLSHYRLVVFAKLILTSPLHIGSGKEDFFSDQPVIRNTGGKPYIPAGTLAGSFAASIDEKQKNNWMGNPTGSEDPNVSSLVMDDAFPLPEQAARLLWPVEHRFHVTLMRESLSALPDHHFNTEILPVGTIFIFSCRCDLTDDVKAFKEALKRFLATGGKLGGKQNAGQGEWQCHELKCALRELKMNDPADLIDWLTDFHGYTWDGKWASLENKFHMDIESFEDIQKVSLENPWQIELQIEIKEGFHLSAGESGFPKKEMADLYQAQRRIIDENGEFKTSELVDFGTSIKGRIRTAMEMVLRTWLIQFEKYIEDETIKTVPLNPTHKSPNEGIASLFGHTRKKGQFRVEEHPWKNGDMTRQDHIQLDEFTQQVIRGAKFEFSPMNKGKTETRICLSAGAPDWQKALLFSACKILSLNVLPWGGHGSRGYVGADVTMINIEMLENEIKSKEWRAEFKRCVEKGGAING